ASGRTRRGRPSSGVRGPSVSGCRSSLLQFEGPLVGLDPRDVAAHGLQPARILELAGGLLEPQLPDGLLQLLLFLGQLHGSLAGQWLPFLLLHEISASDSRVMKRVFRPILSAARFRASLAVARSTPSIS